MKISAVQAALLTGRNERRIRDWITTQRLPATKVGHTWQIDIEDLERVSGIRINSERLALLQNKDDGALQEISKRVIELERTVQDLRSALTALTMRIDKIESLLSGKGADVQKYALPYSLLTKPGDLLGYTPHPENELLPAGSIRMKQFALLHKVHASMLTYQIETGKIVDTPVHMANGRKAHWLTPDQQGEVIAFWQRNGTHFVPCPACPHGGYDKVKEML